MSRFLVVILLLTTFPAMAGQDVVVLNTRPSDKSSAQPPVVYWPEVRQTPRPLRIHVARLDLHAPGFELTALISKDPDADGPAEAELETPAALARQASIVAAINANAFNPVPKTKTSETTHFEPHQAVDIIGWATDGHRQASAPLSRFASFWLDPEGRPHIDDVDVPAEARVAVAGFKELLIEGRDVTIPTNTTHPRTAVGFDRAGRYLWLVVVDGRQVDYSEGMTLPELAAFMKELGCWRALNLDGGGSSILLLDTGNGEGLRVMNNPSGRGTRPVPVMLGVRQRK